MAKKSEKKEIARDPDINKIWCPARECIQYVKACEANCKKKRTCLSYRDYLEPKLF
ncbi:MAG TPA: hypothetical protein VK435_10240 [Thermodesulfovibrionales bacterium]|nr:hypothetical protein [Thermodesulfovibrionales bacterium]